MCTAEPAEKGAWLSKVNVANDMLITGASGVTEMHTSGTGTTGVKICLDGNRWYLRVYLIELSL